MSWEKVEGIYDGIDIGTYQDLYRAKVPGGWLVRISTPQGQGLTFYPDPKYYWESSSIV